MLNKRLQKIYDFINKGMIVADIGTDHAFLPIELVLSNKCDLVFAVDNKDGPLKIARDNIISYGLDKQIILVKSDGLKSLHKKVDVIVIAGMGYHTAKKILEADLINLKNYKQIIVQVNNNIYLFRKWLSDNNFTIVNEVMVKEKHYYTVIEFNTDYHQKYTEKEIMFGPVLLKEKRKEFIEYLNYKLNKLKKLNDLLKEEAKLLKNQNLIATIENLLNFNEADK